MTDLIASRIDQGRGETLFQIGIEGKRLSIQPYSNLLASIEDGTNMNLSKKELDQCLQTISEITHEINADYANIDELNGLDTHSKPSKKPNQGSVAHLMIRKRPKSVQDLIEIRVAVVGNVDAGKVVKQLFTDPENTNTVTKKSTMLGVLTKGTLDDGRGKARVNLFRHKHELESGRTSSIGGEIMGFDSKSKPIIQTSAKRAGSWDHITDNAAKVLSFVDLAGHEKYLKTTVFGMTGSAPEFAMLMVTQSIVVFARN